MNSNDPIYSFRMTKEEESDAMARTCFWNASFSPFLPSWMDRTTRISLRLQDEMDVGRLPERWLEPALFIVDKPVNSTNFAAQRDSPNRLTKHRS